MINTGDKVYSRCGEVFNYDTPDFDKGDTYYEGEAVEISPKDLVYDGVAYDIIESMEERLFEMVGEVADGNLNIEPQYVEQLQKYIEDFMERHAKVSCYHVVNVEEKVME